MTGDKSLKDVAISAFGYHQRVNLTSSLRDSLHNTKLARQGQRILIGRTTERWRNHYNQHFLQWVRRHVPEAASIIELNRFSNPMLDWNRYALFAPWIQDPLRERDLFMYDSIRGLEQNCHDHNIPVVNPVASLSNAIKSAASARLSAAGIRCAKVVEIDRLLPIHGPPQGLDYPFIIRENRLHSGDMQLISSPEDLPGVDLSGFENPIAVEYIDVRSKDGYFRKYRYMVAGESGAPRHLIISVDWIVRAESRQLEPQLLEEEISYTQSRDAHHDILVSAARALDLDVVAFDYSLDQKGQLVLWEPNPYPLWWSATNRKSEMQYQSDCINNLYAALLTFYLERAGLVSSSQ